MISSPLGLFDEGTSLVTSLSTKAIFPPIVNWRSSVAIASQLSSTSNPLLTISPMLANMLPSGSPP